MEQPEEARELRIKKYEKLYDFTRSSLSSEHSRYERIENKIARLLTLLAIVLGFSSFGLGHLAKTLGGRMGVPEWGFVCSYAVFFMAALSSLFAFMRSLAFGALEWLDVRKNLLDYFDQHRYIDILYSISRDQIEATLFNRKVISKKIKRVKFGNFCLLVAIVMIPLIVVFYVLSSTRTVPPIDHRLVYLGGFQ
ncbi:MAG: hypothetical protein FJY66_03875 [Calditrichaeota bacterium]|nr:hypothetical protein [Calditrichota bacterium]